MPGFDDIVLFGIKAGIKLARQGRQAYVEATINRELVLPLPDFNPAVTLNAATAYFRGGGRVHLKDNPPLKALFDKADANASLSKEEEEEFLLTYQELKLLDDVDSGLIKGTELGFTKDTFNSLVSSRQWARNNTPFPSPAQRIVGTCVEIGVDYFASTPGAIDEKSASGRALKGFLRSIEELNFAEEKVEQIARTLFLGALEAIGENPALLGADDKTSQLVEAVSRGLLHDVRKRLDQLAGGDLAKGEKIQDWAQLVLRSVLGNAGETVFSNPKTYLSSAGPGEQALISAVGTSILDVIIDEDSIDLSDLFGRDGVDKVVKAALGALAEYPDLIGIDQQGIKKILSQIARELSQTTETLGADLLPEVMRLVLDKSAQNADLLWPDGFQDPGKHLLITASKVLMEQLAKPAAPGDSWKPGLSRSQILEILEVCLDEVVENPEWLLELGANGDPLLGELLEAVIGVLRKVPSNRLSTDTAVAILKAVIRSVALRRELLDRIVVDGEGKMAIVAVLERIVDGVLSDATDSKAKWTLARGEVLSLIVSRVSAKLSETGVSVGRLKKLSEELTNAVEALKSGRLWSIDAMIESIGAATA